MSLVLLFLLDLMLLSALGGASSASELPPMRAPAFAQGTSRRIVHISKGPSDGVAVDRKIKFIKSLNSSIPDPHWRKYNMWQALRADGRTNFCILFFAVYISYLVYVLF